MLSGPALEDLPVEPPWAFCPWFSGRNREWGNFGETTFAEARNYQGSISQYLERRNDDVPLIVAVQSGDVVRVRRLLQQGGGDVNAAGREGETALHMAAALGTSEIVDLLCENHADPAALSDDNSTPILHCARFCPSPDAALCVADILLSHGADPTTAVGECTPLYYALRRPLIPLAERLIPLTDLSTTAPGDVNPYLSAALDALRAGHRESLHLFLQHASSLLHERDLLPCLSRGNLAAFDSLLSALPPNPGRDDWLRDNAKDIALQAFSPGRLNRRPISETIAILDRALQYGLSPSDLVSGVCEYEDKLLLEWAAGKGARLTIYSKEDLSEMISYLPLEWRQVVLQLWDAQKSQE